MVEVTDVEIVAAGVVVPATVCREGGCPPVTLPHAVRRVAERPTEPRNFQASMILCIGNDRPGDLVTSVDLVITEPHPSLERQLTNTKEPASALFDAMSSSSVPRADPARVACRPQGGARGRTDS